MCCIDSLLGAAHFQQCLYEIDMGIGEIRGMPDCETVMIASRRQIAFGFQQVGEVVVGAMILRLFFEQAVERGARVFIAASVLIHHGQIVSQRHIIGCDGKGALHMPRCRVMRARLMRDKRHQMQRIGLVRHVM